MKSPRLRLVPLATLILVAVSLAMALRSQTGRPRNVILISLDTLRADHLGEWGYPRDTSPQLDAFARRSVVFRRAVAQANSTIPSHASLFTSRYPSSVLAIQRLAEWPETLAERLHAAGFSTWGFVDGGNVRRHFGFAQGFDHYEDDGVGIAVLAKRARAWLEKHPQEPFFLFLHCYDIHTPYSSPPEYVALFGDPDYRGGFRPQARYFQRLNRGEIEISQRGIDEVVARYDADIRYTDERIGAFLDWLEARGVLSDSVVVILSDHGEAFREHGTFGHTELYLDPNLRVPLIFRVPGVKPRVVEETVELVDVVPTILELVGLPPLDGAVGRSLASVVRGEHDAPGDRVAYAELGAQRGFRTAVTDRHQLLIRNADASRQLFDFSADRWDYADVAAAQPDVVDRLERVIEERWTRSYGEGTTRGRHERRRRPEPLDEKTRRELEALGYLEP